MVLVVSIDIPHHQTNHDLSYLLIGRVMLQCCLFPPVGRLVRVRTFPLCTGWSRCCVRWSGCFALKTVLMVADIAVGFGQIPQIGGCVSCAATVTFNGDGIAIAHYQYVQTTAMKRERKIGKKLYTGVILRSGEGGATVAAGPGCASEQDWLRDYGEWK